MARTNSDAVQALLLPGGDYDGSSSLTPFIDTATIIVDRVEARAIARNKTLSTTELEAIERWLAAHCYVQSNQTLSNKSTAGAGGSFHGQTGMYFEGSKYGQMAVNLDYSGCLLALGKRQVASAFWTGKIPSEQTNYVDRN